MDSNNQNIKDFDFKETEADNPIVLQTELNDKIKIVDSIIANI